jgi:post-segregation antitoxin (ccd killing protein)
MKMGICTIKKATTSLQRTLNIGRLSKGCNPRTTTPSLEMRTICTHTECSVFKKIIFMRQKVSCNTTINRDLLHKAKSLNIRLSEVFEDALVKAVASKQKEKWLKQNSDAISQHNDSINKHGTFSEMIGQLDD